MRIHLKKFNLEKKIAVKKSGLFIWLYLKKSLEIFKRSPLNTKQSITNDVLWSSCKENPFRDRKTKGGWLPRVKKNKKDKTREEKEGCGNIYGNSCSSMTSTYTRREVSQRIFSRVSGTCNTCRPRCTWRTAPDDSYGVGREGERVYNARYASHTKGRSNGPTVTFGPIETIYTVTHFWRASLIVLKVFYKKDSTKSYFVYLLEKFGLLINHINCISH